MSLVIVYPDHIKGTEHKVTFYLMNVTDQMYSSLFDRLSV